MFRKYSITKHITIVNRKFKIVNQLIDIANILKQVNVYQAK